MNWKELKTLFVEDRNPEFRLQENKHKMIVQNINILYALYKLNVRSTFNYILYLYFELPFYVYSLVV